MMQLFHIVSKAQAFSPHECEGLWNLHGILLDTGIAPWRTVSIRILERRHIWHHLVEVSDLGPKMKTMNSQRSQTIQNSINLRIQVGFKGRYPTSHI